MSDNELTPPDIPPGFLTDWCDVLSSSSESPPGAFLPTGLALLSAIAGPRLVMRWGVAHEERMNLWVLNVGQSALARKTSGLAGVRSAVRWADTDQIRTITIARISDAGLVAGLDVVGPDTAKLGADDPAEQVVRPVPVAWIATFNEVSPVWMEDGPGWAMDAQRTMLAVYDGHLSSTTRATSIPAQECFVAAIGNIPPRVLREQTTLGMLSSGFVGRWLVIPTPPPERVVSFPMPNGINPLERLRSRVTNLHAVAERSPHRVVVNDLWTEDAKYLRHQWYSRHRERIEALDPSDPIAAANAELFGRLQATAVKVATLLAVGGQADRIERLNDVRVTCDEVAWASQVIDASIDYVTHCLRESGADSTSVVGKVEQRVMRYLERVGATSEANSVTYRAITGAVKGGSVARTDALRAIEALLAAGHIEAFEDGRSRRACLSQAGE